MPCARSIDVLKKVDGLRTDESAGRSRLRREVVDLVRDEGLVEAAYSYRIVPLDAPAGEQLRAGGETFDAPWLLPRAGRLTALACATCTIGPGIETRIANLVAGRRASRALALDQLGNELLFEVSRIAQDRMLADATRRGLTMAGELRPGDPGLALDAQAAVLRLADAAAIGIELNAGMLMRPHKSTSMVLGVGIDLPAVAWSRCQHCRSRARCRHGAAAPAAA